MSASSTPASPPALREVDRSAKGLRLGRRLRGCGARPLRGRPRSARRGEPERADPPRNRALQRGAGDRRLAAADPKLGSALARAKLCLGRARELVDGVFDFARSGGRPTAGSRADVRDVVRQVVDDARHALDPDGRVEVRIDPMPEVFAQCRRGVLASIVGNLVRNALLYIADSAVRLVSVRVSESGDRVRIEVEDTGPGIPAGLEEAIWEPYVRGEGVTQPGLGLGLATVRRFCEAHGGTVAVRSEVGRGASFRVVLPRACLDLAAPRSGEAGEAPSATAAVPTSVR